MNNSDRKITISIRSIMTGAEVRQTLAKNIKKLRAQKGFSQAQLAEEADISLPFMSSIEQSSKWPYPDTLAQIAAALGVDVSDLFSTGENDAKNHQQTIEIMKALVENQKKALDDFGEKYLK